MFDSMSYRVYGRMSDSMFDSMSDRVYGRMFDIMSDSLVRQDVRQRV